jgi:hypothetical protein
VNGRVAGVKASSAAQISVLDLIGEMVRISAVDGSPTLIINNQTGKHDFFGTIFAENLEGDVVDSAAGQIEQVSFPIGDTATKQVISFTIDPQPFHRSVIIMPLRVQGSSGGTDLIRFRLLKNGASVDVDNVNVGTGGGSANTITFSATISASQSATFILEANSANASKLQTVEGQAVVIQSFKQGSTISLN